MSDTLVAARLLILSIVTLNSIGCGVANNAVTTPAANGSSAAPTSTPPVASGPNYGSQFYSYVDFPADNWPGNPVPGTSVSIGNPTGLAVDAIGNLYIAGPSIVFKLDTSGMLTRIAGNGHNGYSGDGGPAKDALLGFPRATPYDLIDWYDVMSSLAFDLGGNLYITDMFNNRVRKVTPDGIISTVAGDGQPGTGGTSRGDGGAATSAQLWMPVGAVIDFAGRLSIAEGGGIRQVTPDGVIATIAGTDCGFHLSPGVCSPEGAAIDSARNLYVADGYCRIREVALGGAITTVAGDERPSNGFNFTCGYSGDGGPAIPAALNGPYGLAEDSAGNLYIADTYNNRVRKLSLDGTITTVAGSGATYGPSYKGSYSGDGGPATNATLNLPHGIAVDKLGDIYISDTENFVVRKVTPNGIITTVAGNGVW